MPLIDKRSYNVTENHYHGDSTKVEVKTEEVDLSNNKVTQNINYEKTNLDILKSILSLFLQIIGGLAVAYIIYQLGWN